jgi:hypothetical protein
MVMGEEQERERMRFLRICAVLAFMAALGASPVYAQQSGQDAPPSTEDLAKAAANPVASMASLPIQNNTNFNFAGDNTQNVLNIEPVYPFKLSESWNLITRAIVPVMWQPVPSESASAGFGDVVTPASTTTGIGDINLTAFFSPNNDSKLIWGAGPSFLLNTATSSELGTGMWSGGPSVVVLTMPGRWVIGSLFTQLWSFAGSGAQEDGYAFHFHTLVPAGPEPTDVNTLIWQYFITYNLNNGWFLTSGPTASVNWDADERFLFPVGGGVGKIVHLGSQVAKWELEAFYNVIRPDGAASWTFMGEFVLLFPM